MKKLLSIAAVAALLSTGAIATDTITLQATIAPAATVQLENAFTASDLTDGTGVFNDYAMASRMTIPLALETALVDQPLFLQSNGDASGVTMSLAYTDMVGLTATGEKIPLKCYYDEGTTATTLQATETPFSLSSTAGTNDGSAAVGQLKITATPANNQVAQNYDGTVTVTITPA